MLSTRTSGTSFKAGSGTIVLEKITILRGQRNRNHTYTAVSRVRDFLIFHQREYLQ